MTVLTVLSRSVFSRWIQHLTFKIRLQFWQIRSFYTFYNCFIFNLWIWQPGRGHLGNFGQCPNLSILFIILYCKFFFQKLLWTGLTKTSKFAWELYIYRFPTFVAHTFEDWLRWRYLSYLNVCSKISGEDLSGSKCPAWSHPLLPSSFPPARVTLTEAHVTLTLTPGHHFPLCLPDSRGTPVQCAESRVWSCSERVEREQENITEFQKVRFPVSSASFRLGGSPFLFPWQVCFWHLN